jgi:hypothetical protein
VPAGASVDVVVSKADASPLAAHVEQKLLDQERGGQ